MVLKFIESNVLLTDLWLSFETIENVFLFSREILNNCLENIMDFAYKILKICKMYFAYKRSLEINRAYKYKATPTPSEELKIISPCGR